MATNSSIDKLFSFLEEQNPILFKGQPPRLGLVPQSGDWNAPDRWIRPKVIAEGKITTNPNFDAEAQNYQLEVLERTVKSLSWGGGPGGANVRFRLENLGDVLREIVGNGAEDYIEEKLERVERSLGDSEWKAPLDKQSQGMLIRMQMQLEKFPAKSERAKLAQQLMMAGVRRDIEKIKYLIGKVRALHVPERIVKQEGGLSDGGTVVTSTNPGIFTPTYGGSGQKKKKTNLFKEWLQNAQVAHHTHDGFQEHPVAVKDHKEYFSGSEKTSSSLPFGEELTAPDLRRFYAAYKLRQSGNLDAAQKEFVESMIGGVSDDELKEFFRQQYGRQKQESAQKTSSMKIPDTIEGIDAELRALGRARVRPWGSKDVAAQNNISDRIRQLNEEKKKLEKKNNIQKFQDFINTTKSDLSSPWFGKTYAEILDDSYQLYKNEVLISKEELLKLIDLNEIELNKMLE